VAKTKRGSREPLQGTTTSLVDITVLLETVQTHVAGFLVQAAFQVEWEDPVDSSQHAREVLGSSPPLSLQEERLLHLHQVTGRPRHIGYGFLV